MKSKVKRLYERPAMQVVELREMPQLLAGSTEMPDYNRQNTEDW